MAYRSLRDFIAQLERDGELVRVSEPVSTVLEMTEIATRLLKTGGPAVLFENPIRADGEKSDMPCLVNLFGTVKRVAMGVTLGGEPRTTAGELREVGEILAFLRQPTPPKGLKGALDMLPLAQTVLSMRPNTVKKAPVQEVVWKGDQIDLSKLPVQTCWPGEPAPLITWPLVVTKGPSDSREDNYNLGIYRMPGSRAARVPCAAARGRPSKAVCACRLSPVFQARSRRTSRSIPSPPRWTYCRPSPVWLAPPCPPIRWMASTSGPSSRRSWSAFLDRRSSTCTNTTSNAPASGAGSCTSPARTLRRTRRLPPKAV